MTSEPLTGEWVDGYRTLGSPEHLHALGVIAATFNMLEDDFYCLFCKALKSKYDDNASNKVFAALTNNTRLDIVRNFLNEESVYSKHKENLLYAVLAYDICAENRNFLMHSVGYIDYGNEPTYIFSKHAQNDPTRLIQYPLSVANLREVADATMDAGSYLISLVSWIDAYHDIPEDQLGDYARSTYPERPPKPRKLSLLCREALQAAPPQPQSSPPSPQSERSD